MSRVLLLLLMLPCFMPINAQTVTEITQSINKIKLDTMYIYAEATMNDLNESYNGARAILEIKVGDWVRKQHPNEGVEVCIVKAKEHFVQIQTRRGDLFRAFVFVRKTDILPVADKSEVTVFEVTPISKENQPIITPTIISKEESVAQDKNPIIELTSEEQQMKRVRSFYDVEPYIKELRSKGKLKNYGKYATMPANEDCNVFVYDKQGNISALLRKCSSTQHNLITLKEDNIKNYKNCGAIWFQLKD